MESPQLHHCTKFDSLRSILESRHFRPSFCLEQSDFMEEYKSGAYAVVCFADLLSNEVERHLNSFNADSYIVMSKEWALKNGVTPVIYYYPETISAVAIRNWTRYCANKKMPTSKNIEETLVTNTTNLMFAYMKQYEGVYFNSKKGDFSDDRRVFFLEREWRWIPFVENGEAYYLSKELFFDENIRKDKRNELINHDYTLKFSPEDVIEVGIPQIQVEDFRQKFGEKYKVFKL